MPASYIELAKCTVAEITEAAATLIYNGIKYIVPLSVIYPDDKDDLVVGAIVYVRVKGWFIEAEKIIVNNASA
jgi:hypothetical protein